MVNNSILTNPEAFVALRNLEQTNQRLATTQNRVSTGLKVTGAVDDASNFAIAQGTQATQGRLGEPGGLGGQGDPENSRQ
jgi:flagellin